MSSRPARITEEYVEALEARNGRLRAALDRARSALLAIRDPFWVPPNVVEEIDRHLAAIETALGPEQQT